MKKNQLLQLVKENVQGEGVNAIRSEVTGEEVHIYVNGVIDDYWGANTADLVEALKDAGTKTVHLHINSPGGDVFEARAMAAALVAHKGDVVSHIDGMAASAATYLALAAGKVLMTDGGLFMVHNSWTFAMGDRTALRSTADLLEKIDGTILADYSRKTGADAAKVTAWMDAETWFTAAEALDAKFIDAIEPNTKGESAAAHWNLAAYANAPKPKEPVQAPALDDVVIAAQLQKNRNRMRLMDQASPRI